jgi:aminoglycoside phosphotransferase (APT) family kinase protein
VARRSRDRLRGRHRRHPSRSAPIRRSVPRRPAAAGQRHSGFSHNDLGIEHILVVPATGAITGVIDWSDAALTDPARDFGLLYRDLGPAALAAALTSYRAHDTAALGKRAAFYARCGLLEDLAYGHRSGIGAYTDKSVTALQWLFPG